MSAGDGANIPASRPVKSPGVSTSAHDEPSQCMSSGVVLMSPPGAEVCVPEAQASVEDRAMTRPSELPMVPGLGLGTIDQAGSHGAGDGGRAAEADPPPRVARTVRTAVSAVRRVICIANPLFDSV